HDEGHQGDGRAFVRLRREQEGTRQGHQPRPEMRSEVHADESWEVQTPGPQFGWDEQGNSGGESSQVTAGIARPACPGGCAGRRAWSPEEIAAPDRGRYAGIARAKAFAAGSAGDLGRSQPEFGYEESFSGTS